MHTKSKAPIKFTQSTVASECKQRKQIAFQRSNLAFETIRIDPSGRVPTQITVWPLKILHKCLFLTRLLFFHSNENH